MQDQKVTPFRISLLDGSHFQHPPPPKSCQKLDNPGIQYQPKKPILKNQYDGMYFDTLAVVSGVWNPCDVAPGLTGAVQVYMTPGLL